MDQVAETPSPARTPFLLISRHEIPDRLRPAGRPNHTWIHNPRVFWHPETIFWCQRLADGPPLVRRADMRRFLDHPDPMAANLTNWRRISARFSRVGAGRFARQTPRRAAVELQWWCSQSAVSVLRQVELIEKELVIFVCQVPQSLFG
jgi:hypothetical protein